MTVPPYRVTGDDLPDADKKTQRALEPLLESLNRVIGSLVGAVNSFFQPKLKEASFTTDAYGGSFVDLKLGAPATELWLTAIASGGNIVTTGYAFSWIAQPQGVRLLFVGLSASATFQFKVRYVQ